VKNITLKLDDATVEWARTLADEQRTSVSRLVADMLAERMRADRRYEAAYRHFRGRAIRSLTKPGEALPSRESLHDRARLR
jgi:hypothetical protein